MTLCKPTSDLSQEYMGDNYNEDNLRLVRNCVLLDIRSRCDYGSHIDIDWSDIKLLWNLIYRHSYNLPLIEFSDEEKHHFLATVMYRGMPLPGYMNTIDEWSTENYINEAHADGRFSSFGFEIFLADYIVYIRDVLFEGEKFSNDTEKWLCESLRLDIEGVAYDISRYYLSVYYGDVKLMDSYDITSWSGYMGLLGFCLRWKSSSFSMGCIDTGLSRFLNSPSPTVNNADCTGFTIFMEAVYWSDKRIVSKYDLSNEKEALGYLGWFVRYCEPDIEWYKRPEWVDELLFSPSQGVPGARDDGLMYLMEAVWYSDKEIQYIWDILHKDERRNYIHWFTQTNKKLLGGSIPEWMSHSIRQSISAFNSNSDQVEAVEENAPPRLEKAGLSGVNLVGWPRTEIGIGEDVRVAAMAFDSVKLPFVIQDAARRIPPSPRQIDTGFEYCIEDNPKYDIDVVFLDASTQYKYHSYDLFQRSEVGRLVIGVCPWELPVWPDSVAFSLDTLDYFWASTRFIYNAFEPYFGDGKIALAPPAVVIPENEVGGIVDFQGDGPFTYLTIFDGLSSIHRKNPMAVVAAFKLAFKNNGDVRLVIKMMNIKEDNSDFNEFMRQVGKDERIQIINKTVSHSDLFDLIRCSHCFVSLHRSEGFGRNIAESMILGRPVICSAYSGNVDFCFPDNSYLCEGSEIAVKSHEYAFSHGQKWFDASIDHAASLMREVYENQERAVQVAHNARSYMLDAHSIENAGKCYMDLLKAITG